ncbi:hypothetical protein T492DRAFT_1032053 [Pavlovales sp. CCMP2436]|nr:hypothetical protein T492DRAFT_1032053 [Pavlovales sp. CCMP2436]
MAPKAKKSAVVVTGAVPYDALFASLSAALTTAADIATQLAKELPAALAAQAVAQKTDDEQPAGGSKKRANADKEKKAKDPNAPKRPMTAFLAFSHERRPAFVAENPSVTGRAISVGMAAEWKVLDPAKKAPYEKVFHAGMDGWRDAKGKYNGEPFAATSAAGKVPAAPTAPAAPAAKPAPSAAGPSELFVAPPMHVDRTGTAEEEEERRRKKEEKKKRKDKEAADGSAKKHKKHKHSE